VNAQAIAQLGVGLLGVWAFIEALLVFPRVATAAPFQYALHGAWGAFAAMALPFVLLLALSYLLVFHAAAVARRVLSTLDLESTGPLPDVACVLVGLAGVFVLLNSLPGLVQAWMVRSGFEVPAAIRLRVWVASLVQAGVGLFLILRPGILVALWRPQRAVPPGDSAA